MARIEIRIPDWMKGRALGKAKAIGLSLSRYLRMLIMRDNPSKDPVKRIPCIRRTGVLDRRDGK